MRLSPQRNPEAKPVGLTQKAAEVPAQNILIRCGELVPVAVMGRTEPGVYDAVEYLRRFLCLRHRGGKVKERLAQVENALQPKAKFADRRAINGLVVQPKL